MKILALLMNHRHYWGVPHVRSSDKKLVQTCYGCGAERKIKVDLRPSRVPTDADIQDHRMKPAFN